MGGRRAGERSAEVGREERGSVGRKRKWKERECECEALEEREGRDKGRIAW